MDISSKIISFLELGYFLDYQGESVLLPEKISSLDQSSLTWEDLFITVRQKLLNSFARSFSPGQACVVPLSGGLDSRAVLGGLLQFTDASNIITYTYGIPGSFDYEIASKVAHKAGVNNIRIPLDKYDYTLDELVETSLSMDHQTLLFFHAPLRRIQREFPDGVHWSGFLGEAITGDHIRGELAHSMDDAADRFLNFNRFVKGTDSSLLSGGMEYARKQLHCPSSTQGFLTYEEGFDLLNRQNKYIAPHVMLKGFEHRAPFNDPAVIAFFLGLSESQKRHQLFFKSFLQWWRPQLFDLPVKNNVGFPLDAAAWRPRWRKKMFGLRKRLGRWKDPNINYFDFSGKLIHDSKLKTLVSSQLNDLGRRKILPDHIKPQVLWSEHQCRTADHGKLIQGLASLEIHLKSGKEL